MARGTVRNDYPALWSPRSLPPGKIRSQPCKPESVSLFPSSMNFVIFRLKSSPASEGSISTSSRIPFYNEAFRHPGHVRQPFSTHDLRRVPLDSLNCAFEMPHKRIRRLPCCTLISQHSMVLQKSYRLRLRRPKLQPAWRIDQH